MPEIADLWAFLPLGYALTVGIELPVLWWGLSERHSARVRLTAAFWLTACTYPVVILVLPLLVWRDFGEAAYLAVAETFAPLAECLLFWLAFDRGLSWKDPALWRDMAAIVAANLTSFLLGRWLFAG